MRKSGCERLARGAHPQEARKRGVVRTDGPGAQARSLRDCAPRRPARTSLSAPPSSLPLAPSLRPSLPRSLAPSLILSPRQVFSSQRPGPRLAPTLWCASKSRWRLPTRALVRGRAGPRHVPHGHHPGHVPTGQGLRIAGPRAERRGGPGGGPAEAACAGATGEETLIAGWGGAARLIEPLCSAHALRSLRFPESKGAPSDAISAHARSRTRTAIEICPGFGLLSPHQTDPPRGSGRRVGLAISRPPRSHSFVSDIAHPAVLAYLAPRPWVAGELQRYDIASRSCSRVSERVRHDSVSTVAFTFQAHHLLHIFKFDAQVGTTGQVSGIY